METVTCALCGSDHSSVYAVVPDLLLDRPDVTTRLVRCDACGLVYQSPRPTLDEIGEHYPPSYSPYADNRRVGRITRLAHAYGMRKRCRSVTRLLRSGRLLDVGCATGTFLAAMRRTGKWDVVGVELSAETARLAREWHGLDVVTGTLEQAQFPDASFDVVTLWDVLEHLHDPATTLREIRRILRPGGLLVLRVPNLDSWDARLFGDSWAGLDAPRHLYVFSPDTLNALLAQSGFEPMHRLATIGGYMVFALDVEFWLNRRGASPRAKQAVKRLLYNPASRLLSVPFFYIPSRLKRGPVLSVAARRPQT